MEIAMNTESEIGSRPHRRPSWQWDKVARNLRGPKLFGASALLFVVYFLVGRMSLQLAYVHLSATALWPLTGITLVVFLMLGYRVWPAILLGAFCVNLSTAGTVATSLGIAIGSTLEGVVGAYLVLRFAGGTNAFAHSRNIFRFACLAPILSTTVSATIGVTSLALGGFAHWSSFGSVWLTWWLGDAVGDAIIAPALLLWLATPLPRWDLRKFMEAAVLALSSFLVGLIVFTEPFYAEVKNYPLSFMCIPFLIWAALRFGARGAATAVVGLSIIAIWGTFQGLGPFVADSHNNSLLFLQSFLGVMSLMNIAVGAVVSEQQLAEKELRRTRDELERLASTDPLTGLANYRRLVDAFGTELGRSQRTGRPFALLLFDLNGLKRINDTHGHLVGSQALCRVAAVLRLHCRSIDTAARYGGDEFALLMPETTADGARYVGSRIAERTASDPQFPPISLSFGFAVFPEDGETIESVFQTADAGLYHMKEISEGRRSSSG